jgi:hypothetical protein
VTKPEPWQPTVREGEKLEDVAFSQWVGEALGAASMCWVGGTGSLEFDSAACARINDALMAHINKVIDDVITGTTVAVSPNVIISAVE